MHTHEFYMKRALELARKGWGKTNPNPLVGAVIVKNGKIIGEGFHEAVGLKHAEISAIDNASDDVRGASIYVTLEPCSHFGRTPPCAKRLVEEGFKEVIIGMRDPNPKVSGSGIRILQDAGIHVVTGILEKEAEKLNEIFIKYITSDKPFVIMKTAMTLDGKIAASSGDSKWISSEASRQYVHEIRDRVAAIMVGINTVLKDDPSLTTRLEGKKGTDPVRIIVDSSGRTPPDCKAVSSESEQGVIIAATSQMTKEKEKCLREKGAVIIKADGPGGRVDLQFLMKEVHKLGLDSVLLEGGAELNASALEAGIVDKVISFIAPKIIGGRTAPSPVGGDGIQLMKHAVLLKDVETRNIGDDIVVEGYIVK